MSKRAKHFDGASPLSAMCYTSTICAALMYTVCRSQWMLCTVIMSIMTAGIYMLFYLLRRRTLMYILTAAVFGAAAWFLMTSASNIGYEQTFFRFIFSSSEEFHWEYAAVTMAIFAIAIGFICNYFTAVSPRPCFLMLTSFIPLILSVRTAGGLPIAFLLAMDGTFVFAAMNTAQPVTEKTQIFSYSGARYARLALTLCLAAAVTLLVRIVPHSEETPFGEILDRYLPETAGFYSGNAGLTNFTSHSSVNTGANQPGDEVLFVAMSSTIDTADYIARWSFDNYEGGLNGWGINEAFDNGNTTLAENVQYLDYTGLMSEIRYAASQGELEEYQELFNGIPYQGTQYRYMTIYLVDGSSTAVIMHPTNAYNVRVAGYSGDIYRNPRDDMFRRGNFETAGSYSMEYYGGYPPRELLSKLTPKQFGVMLLDAYEAEVIDAHTFFAISNELDQAQEYREAADRVPQYITELAEEITAGLESDYDKAVAIERWFGEAEFVYDLDFVPESTDAEYFISESRRGICSDFATAMTLLARGAGLSAKYTEGFVLSEEIEEREGVYYVTPAQSHAYTQIYIPGGGWMVFDGTRYALTAGDVDISETVLYISLGIITAAVVLTFVFREKLSWAGFCLLYSLRKPHGRIKAAYRRARKIACAINGKREEFVTAGETLTTLSNVLGLTEEASEICRTADELFYSTNECKYDTKRIFACIKAIRKKARRYKR